MLSFLVHLVLTAALLLVVANLVRGFEVKSFGSALIGALVLGVVNAVVRPILAFLTFPLTVITLGLFLLVINALMLWLMSALVPGIRIHGFLPAFLAGILLAVLNLIIGLVLPGG